MVSNKTARSIHKVRNTKKLSSTKSFKGILDPIHLPATVGFMAFIFSFGLLSLRIAILPFETSSQTPQLYFQDKLQTPRVKNVDRGYLTDQVNSKRIIDVDKRVLDYGGDNFSDYDSNIEANQSLFALTWQSLKKQYIQFFTKIFRSTNAKSEIFVSTPSLRDINSNDLIAGTIDISDSNSLNIFMPSELIRGDEISVVWNYGNQQLEGGSQAYLEEKNVVANVKSEIKTDVLGEKTTLAQIIDGYSVLEYKKDDLQSTYQLLDVSKASYVGYSGKTTWTPIQNLSLGNYILRVTLYRGVPLRGIKIKSSQFHFKLVNCKTNSNCTEDQYCNVGNDCETVLCVSANECQESQIKNHSCIVINKTDNTPCSSGGTCINGQCNSLRPVLLGDINSDGVVNKLDLDLFINNYKTVQTNYDPIYDINGDNKVDIFDYSLLLKMTISKL